MPTYMKACYVVAMLVLAGATTGCVNMGGWQTVRGSGNIATETRNVSAFDRVSVAGAGELTLVQGEEESLTIEADDNLLPLIESEVVNGRLSIGPRRVNLRPTTTVRYNLRLRDIRRLDLSGSVHATADSVKGDHFVVIISGSGRMDLASLDAGTLTSSISGSGSTQVAGQVKQQKIHVTGSGSHGAKDLKCAEAEADISGSGHVSLWVVDSLTADISGSGRVEYRGNPRVTSHVSGSGRVRRLDGKL